MSSAPSLTPSKRPGRGPLRLHPRQGARASSPAQQSSPASQPAVPHRVRAEGPCLPAQRRGLEGLLPGDTGGDPRWSLLLPFPGSSCPAGGPAGAGVEEHRAEPGGREREGRSAGSGLALTWTLDSGRPHPPLLSLEGRGPSTSLQVREGDKGWYSGVSSETVCARFIQPHFKSCLVGF